MEVEVVGASVVAYGIPDVEVKVVLALVRACSGDVGSDDVCSITWTYRVETLLLLIIATGEERGKERDGPYGKEVFDSSFHTIVFYKVNKVLSLIAVYRPACQRRHDRAFAVHSCRISAD